MMDTFPPHAQRGHSHHIIIPLTQGKFAMLDVEDADLGTYQWCMISRYAARRESNKTLLMHRIVLERKLRRPIQENMMADHINGNPLDNRRSNLREVTLIQNQWNSKKQKNNTTQYIGVTYQDGYYIARIGGQKKILGSFKTALDASFCYDKAALEQRGEYALLNHPIEEVLAWQAPSHYLHSTNTSGYRGVTYVKSGRNWQASIWDGNKRLHLGLHTTAEEAARAYCALAGDHDKSALQADEQFRTTMSTYHDIEQVRHAQLLMHLLEKNGISLEQLAAEGATPSHLYDFVQAESQYRSQGTQG